MKNPTFQAIRWAILFAPASVLAACGDGEIKEGPNNNPPEDTRTSQSICRVSGKGCECNEVRTNDVNHLECNPTAFPGTACCADSGWPQSGSCDCQPMKVAGCNNVSNGSYSCRCSYDITPGPITSCSEPEGTCCLSETECKCYPGKVACAVGASTVSACQPPPPKPATTCYGALVTSCSGSTATANSPANLGGSGGGSGSGGTNQGGSSAALCSPKTGSCESANDCSCGQSCYAVSVCSGCEKRCNIPCTTNQDCIERSAGFTIKYTRCVKTSPGYDIYACEP